MTLTVGMHVMLVAVARSNACSQQALIFYQFILLIFWHLASRIINATEIFRFSADPTFIIVVHKSTLL
jgi:hypothetical protein